MTTGILDQQAEYFSIGQLSERTQVNTVTLRAWERRYGLLKPKRTAKGHRLYSESDVLIIEQVLALVARGVPLGKVKALVAQAALDESIQGMVLTDEASIWQQHIDRLHQAIAEFSSNKVEHLLGELFASYPTNLCRLNVIEPVFARFAARQVEDVAWFAFMESELVRFACLRLSSKMARKRQRQSVLMIAGYKTPLWRLALVSMDLFDSGFAVQFINQPVGVASVRVIARQSPQVPVLFYQDGVWSPAEQHEITLAVQQCSNLLMCGTAPALACIRIAERVFADIDGGAAALRSEYLAATAES